MKLSGGDQVQIKKKFEGETVRDGWTDLKALSYTAEGGQGSERVMPFVRKSYDSLNGGLMTGKRYEFCNSKDTQPRMNFTNGNDG